jgi:type VI secretion system protein ImpC
LDFSRLDDFHPDGLLTMKTVRDAVNQLQLAPAAPPVETAREATEPVNEDSSGGVLFEQLLGKPADLSDPTDAGRISLASGIIAGIVNPHIAKSHSAIEGADRSGGDEPARSTLLRYILHHPDFQALESAWRGLHWLLSRVEESENLSFFLLDLGMAELRTDLERSGGGVEATSFFRLLAGESVGLPGGQPWSMLVANYSFGSDPGSLDILELLGCASGYCGGFTLAAAESALLGCDTLVSTPDPADWQGPEPGLDKRWTELRASPAADAIGLALPRFMLRLPYGQQTEPVESFPFEELAPHPAHEFYLWGNPALACAAVAAERWVLGSPATPVTAVTVGDLPYHVYPDGTEQAVKPCAETYLSETTANVLITAGLIPILSVRNRNSVLLPKLHSIGFSARGLI